MSRSKQSGTEENSWKEIHKKFKIVQINTIHPNFNYDKNDIGKITQDTCTKWKAGTTKQLVKLHVNRLELICDFYPLKI